jgi:hypothetical protein
MFLSQLSKRRLKQKISKKYYKFFEVRIRKFLIIKSKHK